MKRLYKFRLAVNNYVLLFLAGIVWILVGLMLMFLAFSWLSTISFNKDILFTSAGVIVALLAHHFGFIKIVNKNLKRILQLQGKTCVFAFIPWKSYLIIAVMMTMGAVLRHSTIPHQYLAILYIGIGFALILSSERYLRVFVKEIKR